MPLPVWMPVLSPLFAFINLVKSKAVNDIPAARKELDIALGKLDAHYSSIRNAVDYISTLKFGTEDELAKAKTFLMNVKSGDLRRELGAVRAHCGEIKAAYKSHLKGWFSSITNSYKRDELDDLFFNITEGDGNFVDAMSDTADYVEGKVDKLLALMKSEEIKQAAEMVKSIELDVFNDKIKLNNYLIELRQLQHEFQEFH